MIKVTDSFKIQAACTSVIDDDAYVCVLRCNILSLLLGTQENNNNWRNNGRCDTQSPACDFQVASKGYDWGHSVWGCRDASSILDFW
jgi:hypothetical protein